MKLKLSVIEDGEQAHEVVDVGFPYFGGRERPHFTANAQNGEINHCKVPGGAAAPGQGRRRTRRAGGHRVRPAGRRSTASTVGWAAVRRSYDDNAAYTPAWAGEPSPACRATRSSPWRGSSPRTRDKTHGKSMVIIGAAMNHWYHADMNYRGVINLLMMCGCIGQSGGGWAHYVGQEKLRPQTGWTALAFALDWIRPPRQMNSTSFFYAHTDQWRYEKLGMEEIVSPLADKSMYGGSMIDYNVRAERMGWLPSAPQLQDQPAAGGEGRHRRRHGRQGLRGQGAEGRHAADELRRPGCAAELAAQPVRLALQPAGLSGKGHEYFCKHLLGTENGVQGKDLGKDDAKPTEVVSGTTRRRKASSTCW